MTKLEPSLARKRGGIGDLVGLAEMTHRDVDEVLYGSVAVLGGGLPGELAAGGRSPIAPGIATGDPPPNSST